ncbi:capsid maturation protease [Macacine alphaherpesvirus 3]|uniref:Capsid scaffolding protein n=2 Tax=Macacine alphaherpesvirus 3 TaxID=2845555 RepID=A0A1X9WFC0_9ALPH|nr:capsid maturation protease [Macacine alphaherpesvirus 1]ARS01812.1 capsid maturation protease [Macacine alphaherpesvirus 3]
MGPAADPEGPAGPDAERPVPIYVAGYLALYGGGDAGELALDPETVAAALPPAGPLAINVDHRARCEVGRVLAVVDDPRGPFFAGLIACAQLERVLETAASAAIFERRGPPLSREERLLYLVTNYLPSVSLSTRRLEEGEAPDNTLLVHVALCAIGRRLGTIVTYDTSLDAAVAPFRHLAPDSREILRREAAEAELGLGGRVWAPGAEALTRALLSTAVNNMMLRDRWSLVAERRRQAGIAGHTYLQASEKFGLWGAGPGDSPPDGVYKRRSSGAAGPGRDASVGAPRTRDLPSDVPEPEMNPASAGAAAPAPKPPGDGSYLWIPAAHYNQLVAGHAPGPAFGAPVPAPPPAFGAAPAYAPHHPTGVYPGVMFPGPSPLEAQIAALVGAIAADRQSGPAPSAKRRRHEVERDCDYDDRDDAPYYPGEARGPPRAAPDSGGRGRRPAAPGGANETIAALVGAVTSLQQELAHMRARAAPPYGAPYAQARPALGVPVEPPAPQYAPQWEPPAAAGGALGPHHPPPARHQPYAAPANPAPFVPGPQPCAVAPAAQGPAPGAAAPGGQCAPAAGAAASTAEAGEAEAVAALVNASAAAHVDVDVGRAADLFVSQMMGGR